MLNAIAAAAILMIVMMVEIFKSLVDHFSFLCTLKQPSTAQRVQFMILVQLHVLRPVVILQVDTTVPLMDVLRTAVALMTRSWMEIIVLTGLNVDAVWIMDFIYQ